MEKRKKKSEKNAWQVSNTEDKGSNIPIRGEMNKYEEACQQIKDSLKRFIDHHEVEEDNDEEDEHQLHHESEIIGRIFGSYDSKEDQDRVQHHLQEAFRSGSLICLICIDNVKRNDYVWNCKVCYCTFHLDCIQKWAKDSIFLQSQAEEANDLSMGNFSQSKETKEFKWFCPKCRNEYQKTQIPSEYKCFCGKQKNPSFDPWLIPHSCGEKCNRELQPTCGHRCLLLCHPGPCPPCPVMVRHPCYCPKAVSKMRRCSSKAWSCGSVCGRFLACNQHRCKDRCHAGPCATCEKTSNQKCQCGSSSQLRPCADLVWQCDKVCEKEFSCGHHKCQQVCHKGPCGECPFGGQRSCSCGKKLYNLPCTETVPNCGDTCSKPLACAIHFCTERCHKGSCPSCLQVSVKKCNCGSREKELPCTKPFTCEVKCKRLRDCRKHACNRKCCVGDCPPCEHPCSKTLGCGQHKCESRCHQMRCYPCPITHKISCTCGATSITVPCGRERKTPLPKCNVPCKKKSVCHHSKPKTHPCHPGACPPCKRVCELQLTCGHTCPAVCHDAVPIKVVGDQKRAGPWEKITSYVEVKKLPCPSCMVKVPNVCRGKHETSEWACSKLRSYSCGRECGRQLTCSHHQCSKECHVVEGAVDERSQGLNCEPCAQPCSQPGPEGCPHPCKMACHPGPCPQCQEKVRMKCHCGLLPIAVDCHKWITSNTPTKEKMRCCTNPCPKAMSCNHPCQKKCHSGECSSAVDCRKKAAVRCPCRRLRKEFPCHSVISGEALLPCDDVCLAKQEEKKKAEEELKLKKALEEEEKCRKELEEYERFVQGRKRRRRRDQRVTESEDEAWWRKKQVLGVVGVLTTSLIMYIVFYSLAGE